MVGQVLAGRYEIQRLLGEGGMGRVYLARQIDLGRQVVVKVMHDHIAADPTFCERFHRETLLTARFQHPYGVALYDASLEGPHGPYIVMEYIRGITLDDLLHKNKRLTPTRVGRLLGQFCEVLQAAHTSGIVHRDLKPANLMIVDPDSPYEILKVMDFGLAKLLEAQPNQMSISSSEMAVGTPGYMCPEQARGEEMDHRGDLYSVGIILYELLTGRLPFTGEATMDVLISHATEEPPSFEEMGIEDFVSPRIEAVIRKCLAKHPDDRPSNARELAELYEVALYTDAQSSSKVMATVAASGSSTDASNFSTEETPDTAETVELTSDSVVEEDPSTIVHQIRAWMPEMIAKYKLRGFVQDKGGELLESVPGKIIVRLGKKSVYSLPGNQSFSWFGLARPNSYLDMDLHLQKVDENTNELLITVILRPSKKGVQDADLWKSNCTEIFCDLRAYLMGQ